MSVTLGTYTFDSPLTAISETLEEVGGRDARVIKLQGVLQGFATQQALEAALDALLAAASTSEAVALSLRSGRRFLVRRTSFKREVVSSPLTGAFTLGLEAQPAYEEAVEESAFPWFIGVSGATKLLNSSGNLATLPRIELLASQDLILPCFSDGVRSITYDGLVEMGSTIIFDGPQARVSIDGEDVTPYTTGVMPRITPPQTTLTYTDDPSSSHAAAGLVYYRDRWW